MPSIISTEQLYAIYQQHPSVTTDTRKIKRGDIFFALKGPSFNGNVFARQALDAGASYAVIEEEKYATDDRFLVVKDALTVLQELAGYHRSQFNVPVIAITGSNGKTTTKELVHAVLSSQYKTCTTEGNLNNHIGVPLTLLSIQADAQMAVIEMGANHLYEIESYCKYARPTHGLITNVGKAHLEGFGGVEGVRKGKGELFDFLRATNGVAFACADFEYFKEMTRGLPEVHWYGKTDGEITGELLLNDSYLKMKIETGSSTQIIQTQLAGTYNSYNVLAAIAVGKYFEVPEETIVQAIESYAPGNSRSQWAEKGSNHYILDAYNANPTSMAAAVENFASLPAESKILFVGAMMELGEDSLAEHQAIITLIESYNWKEVVLVGGDFKNTVHPYRYFDTADEAAFWWGSQQSKGNYILIKGSRSIRMEKVFAQ